jgi:AcrR family transcriptional regulator
MMPVPKGATLDPARTRAAILESVTATLYEHGLDGIGIAALCSEAGISKETLYRHFGSKDGLISEVLRIRSDRTFRWISDAVESAGDDPARQLAAVFDALGRWYAEPGFRGCAIMNAASQHHANPVSTIARRHLSRYLDLLTSIAHRAGAHDPSATGRQLLMLLEGATVVADHHRKSHAARDARVAALILLAHAGHG